MVRIIDRIVYYNGIYDILCGLSIFFLSNKCILSKFHSNIFIKEHQNNLLIRRLLSYWILTYGLIRIQKNIDTLIIITYFLESIVYILEYVLYKSTYGKKSIFVSLLSIILGILVMRKEK
jgi:hypothetical protein